MNEDEKPKRWGVVCSAKECAVRKEKKKDGGTSFHHYPVNNEETESCQ
jgi:hypothetical protein